MSPGPPRLKKHLGQHHLAHPELCRPLLDYLRPRGRLVVEIGPGGGALTGELLASGARVLAWEIDPEWAFALRRRCVGPALAIAVGDALELRWSGLPPGSLVAGNLPYGVATRLVERMLAEAPGVERCGLLVQWEVARRLVAGPREPDYGALSVLVQARARPVLLARVRRGSFRPPPKVDGAFVGLERRPPPVPEAEWPRFARLVRLAFGQRRKTLRNALAAGYGRAGAERLLAAAGLTPGTRAGELGLERFVDLHRTEVAASGGGPRC